jgi:hypothetical protein
MRSKRWFLNLRDFVRATFVALCAAILPLLQAILTAVVAFLQGEVASGAELDVHLFKRMAVSMLYAALSYLALKVLTDSKGEIGITPEE